MTERLPFPILCAMRGLLIIISLVVAALLLGLLVAWPSNADLDRARLELDRTLVTIQESLAKAGVDYRFIAQRKPANRVKTMLEERRRRLALVRHQAARLGQQPETDLADWLDLLETLRRKADELLGDARDLRARTAEIRTALEGFAPLLREIATLREILGRRERAAAKAGDLARMRELRSAIERSSEKEELVTKAFEAFTSDISTGRVLAQTAQNELNELLDLMRTLAGR